MANKIYHLSSCSTCVRILKQFPSLENVELIDIKKNNIDAVTLDEIKEKVGSYEALFSKRAQKFKALGKKDFTENEYRSLILEEYTFMKRPYMLIEGQVFIGNSAKVVEQALSAVK